MAKVKYLIFNISFIPFLTVQIMKAISFRQINEKFTTGMVIKVKRQDSNSLHTKQKWTEN